MDTTGNYSIHTDKFEAIPLSEINQLKLLKRMDKKYVMSISKLPDLLEKVKNDYKILEINGVRDFTYDTTYFDTPDFDFFKNHQNQRSSRFKIRMRNYKVSNKAFLEVKQKTNKGRTLKSRIEIDELCNLNSDNYNYIESIISLDKHNLLVSSENSFRRITLVSFKTLERITIDYNLYFKREKKAISLSHIAIVEVKRDKLGKASPIVKTLKKLNVYARGFSKYCMGLSYLIPELKQNSFKKNKLYLKKLEYATLLN